jgi:hypothetical protein
MAEGLGLGLDFTVDADGFIAAPEGEDFGLPTESEDGPVGRVRDVELPSGNLTRLEVPGLACLLWAGGSKLKLAKSIWRHPQGGIELFKDLDESEIDYIYEWGLVEFAKLKDSLNLASICKVFHMMPSSYIGIADRMTSYIFDTTISGTLGEEEARQMKQLEKQGKRGPINDLPPDPQDN